MNIKKIIREEIEENIKINEIGDYDMNIITNNRGKVIELINQSGYELSLIKFPKGKSISLTYNNKGYFKPKEQMKQSMEYSGGDILKIFRSFKPYIIGWVKKYGEIYIGSTNKQRVNYYHKWLCNDLKCGGINQNPGLNKNETNYYFTIDGEGPTLTPIRYI
jgi:hypothetical protein